VADGRLKANRPYVRFMRKVLQPVAIEGQAAPAAPRDRDQEIMEERRRRADQWWAKLQPVDKLAFALTLRDHCEGRHDRNETEEQKRRRWADEVWQSISVGNRSAIAHGRGDRE
jgi:hypothetical protein